MSHSQHSRKRTDPPNQLLLSKWPWAKKTAREPEDTDNDNCTARDPEDIDHDNCTLVTVLAPASKN